MVANRNVSLTNYDEQLAAAQRRQKLSEMLQEQANVPIDIQSYKGVQAPISWAAVLAKALQGGVAGYQSKKADEQKAAAEQSGRQQALSDYRAAAANRLTANGEAFTPAGSNVPNPQFSAQKPSMLANILGGGNAQPPPAAPILPQAVPTPQGAPMAAPPIVPVSQAPLPAANPAVGVNMPQMAQAIPVAPPGPVGPVRKAVDFQSKAPTARELEDSSLEMLSSSNPYARSFGQNMFERSQTQLDEQRKLDLIRKEKTLDREEDVNRATSVVSSIPGLSPDQREFLSFQAKALGTEGLKSSLEQMSKNQFGEHYKAASPEELEGYPKGTVGQVSTTTGKLSSVYNPTSDLNSTAQVMISKANLGLHAQEVGISGQRLELEREREKRIGTGGLTPEENDAISKAAAEGRIDPTRLSSRTAKIQASILLANPGINFVNNHAIAVMTANPTFQNKAMLAQALPEVLENVRDAGQKLNFSNVQYIGKLQAWKNGQLNDPDFINYMSQRADALQTITNVMRATGATDKSIELEAKAAPETMSPAAFDAWYEGQMASLKPRLNRIVPMAIKIPGVASAPAGGGATSKVRVYNRVTGRLE